MHGGGDFPRRFNCYSCSILFVLHFTLCLFSNCCSLWSWIVSSTFIHQRSSSFFWINNAFYSVDNILLSSYGNHGCLSRQIQHCNFPATDHNVCQDSVEHIGNGNQENQRGPVFMLFIDSHICFAAIIYVCIQYTGICCFDCASAWLNKPCCVDQMSFLLRYLPEHKKVRLTILP